MDKEKDFFTFLCSISSDEVKDKMIREKIGPDLISIMTDEELAQYIPVHGERLRVRKYLREEMSSKTRGKRSTLLQVLREKIKSRDKGDSCGESNQDNVMRESNKREGNRNAEKDSRKIELGWILKKGGRSMQIRSKKGGGTRKLSVSKEATKNDLLTEGQRLFFPNGKSSKGNQNDFQFDVWDYQDRSMDEKTTVGQMYKDTKMPMLRFYLASVETERDTTEQLAADPDSDSLPDLHRPEREPAKSRDILSEAIQMAGIETEEEMIIDNMPDFNIHVENSDHIYNEENNEIHNNEETNNTNNQQTTEYILKLHRGQVMKELIENFKTEGLLKNCIIKPQLIMPNGEMEAAEDAGGVTRDVLSEFWSSFYTECSLGNDKKVPCLRHDFGEEEWKSVARVIVFGWKTVNYFPVQLSSVFMEYCLYGTFHDDLLDAFMHYIPKADAETLKSALMDVNSVDQTELGDIFSQHELKRVPRQANMERILKEMAHKELLQAAMFVIDCWNPILNQIHMPLEKLQTLYKDLIPTTRRVISLLKFPENMCQDSTATSHHLKRFIREMDSDLLTRFLRFCTGADLLTEKCIEISFVNVEGLARRPVAHTCSSLLEIPKQYENFLQFRTEFVSILNANVWIMDII